MSVFIVTGVLGGGKSLMTISRLAMYVKEGRRIAGNIDVNLQALTCNPRSRCTYTRIPDLPIADDLELIGRGYDGPHDEDKNGALVLDECALWMNAREWNDGRRKALIAWLVHARKKGWDVFLLVQHIDMVDSQVRSALAEYVVTCHALNKIKIPVISMLYKLFTGRSKLPLPKIHVASVQMGRSSSPISVDRWFLSGAKFYAAYDTAQIFTADYAMGTHSLLSPWLLTGRYLPPRLGMMDIFLRLIFSFVLFLVRVFAFGYYSVSPSGRITPRVTHA